MTEDYQPNPDELLMAIQETEHKQNLGKLKIFFGMAAGVGKTYAMLKEAQRRLKEGVDIIVGTINTHGRKETELLLQGLPVLPEKWVKYRDVVFEEMDLETILKRKPAIVLVDELAHTNVPGCRHPKRWQDVVEILDAGIDVYTTLNVQHVESRKDLVETFAGVQIRETVPDLILERAASIELVDISPAELLERLKEGKVYLGNQSQVAARHFFKPDTLTALREIALRFTAEKVDHDLHSILSQGKTWKTHEKLMVAIGPNQTSHQLIRKTRRRAFELDAPWIAVYVDTGTQLTDKQQSLIAAHLNLAQELGAEVITTADPDIPAALLRISKFKNATQLIIGRSYGNRKWNFFRKSLTQRLEEENKNVDLVILREEHAQKIKTGFRPSFLLKENFSGYLISIAAVIGLTVINLLLNPLIGFKSIGFIFLLGILQLSFFLGQGPIILASITSTLAWDYFFIPPSFALRPSYPEDEIFILVYFFTALIIGILNSRLRKQDEFLKLREKKLQHLYEIERVIANASSFPDLRRNITSRLQSVFNGEFEILAKDEKTGQLIFDSSLPALQQEKEQAVAEWVLENGKMAGWSTATLPSAKALYLPIQFSSSQLGVLAYIPHTERLLSVSEINFLYTVAKQAGISLERRFSESRKAELAFTAQIEKMRTSLPRSISQRFFNPLNEIFETAKVLDHPMIDKESHSGLQHIEHASRKLQWMIEYVLTCSELESGFMRFEMSKQNLQEFIEHSLKNVETYLPGEAIRFVLPKESIIAEFDSALMQQALKNLFLFLAFSSPIPKPLLVEAGKDERRVRISVSCEDYLLEPDQVRRILEKSKTGLSSPSDEEELGLSIASSVMNIHQGEIEVRELGKNGIIMALLIPYKSVV